MASVNGALVALGGAAEGDGNLLPAVRDLLSALCLVVTPGMVAGRAFDLKAYAAELKDHARAVRQSATGFGHGRASKRRPIVAGVLATIARVGQKSGWPAAVEYLIVALPDFLPELRRIGGNAAAVALAQTVEAGQDRGRRRSAKLEAEDVLAIVLQAAFTVPDESTPTKRRKISPGEAWDLVRMASR